MEFGANDSAKLKIGRYLLDKIESTDSGNVQGISEEELVEACGIRDRKQLNSIFRTIYRGMFSKMDGEIFPMFRDFDGREGFLEHLEFTIHALENPQGKEGRGRIPSPGESGFHISSFGSRRRL